MRVRFGHFNIRDLTAEKLRDPANAQVRAAAEIIKKFRPEVLSINEMECCREAPDLFLRNFLNKADWGDPLDYRYYYQPPTNSGIYTANPPPFEQKGFGLFPGQYGLALFSSFPILKENILNFNHFSWRDLPDSYLGCDMEGVPLDIPLFTTSFADVPVSIGDCTLHIIMLHASIPVRGYLNAQRNADQLKFLNQYISEDPNLPGIKPKPGRYFVIMGDLNSDPEKGDSERKAINDLIANSRINYKRVSRDTFMGPDLNKNTGEGVQVAPLELRLNYILPSRDIRIKELEIFRPEDDRYWWDKARQASDHFFLWADLEF